MEHAHCNCHCHHHGHGGHHHHHHHHHGFDPALAQRFIWAITVNIIFVAGEFYLGWHYNSAGLLADAGHNLGDVGGLVISLAAFLLLKKSPDQRFTYAFKRATILAAFVNALVLAAAIVMIVWECISRFRTGAAVSGCAVMATAAAGIAVNGFTVLLLSKGKNEDLNVKSAYLHMLADTLVSLGVVVSGGLIALTGWNIIDPITGLLIAGLIAMGSRELFFESTNLLLDGVPRNINTALLLDELHNHQNIADIFHTHIRALSTTENSFTAQIMLHDPQKQEATRLELKTILKAYNITHSTLEFVGSKPEKTAEYGCF